MMLQKFALMYMNLIDIVKNVMEVNPMTNFDFLKQDEQFNSFADPAISAEQILHIDRLRLLSTAAGQWSLP